MARFVPIGSELPQSTRYSCVCVREDGQWKVALQCDWGADEAKLEDLSWLIGDWAAKTNDREWNELSLERRGNPDRQQVHRQGRRPRHCRHHAKNRH